MSTTSNQRRLSCFTRQYRDCLLKRRRFYQSYTIYITVYQSRQGLFTTKRSNLPVPQPLAQQSDNLVTQEYYSYEQSMSLEANFRLYSENADLNGLSSPRDVAYTRDDFAWMSIITVTVYDAEPLTSPKALLRIEIFDFVDITKFVLSNQKGSNSWALMSSLPVIGPRCWHTRPADIAPQIAHQEATSDADIQCI